MLNLRRRLKSYIDKAVAYAVECRCQQASQNPLSEACNILSNEYGHARSQQAKLPVSSSGLPLPWYTYPAIEYCNQLHASGLKIFEYGCGNSSLYWAHKGAEVWCVEHDKEWYEQMRAKSSRLRGIVLREECKGYAEAIGETAERFDVVILDGAWRNACAAVSVQHLRDGGIIILDNSDWYADVARYLRERDYFQVDFNGFGPINPYCWTTSFFLPFRSPLTERLRQPTPIGGIEAGKHDKW